MNKKQQSGFTLVELMITIAIIGIVCALLGRMLGDVGNYWQILIGLVLVWVALGMLGFWLKKILWHNWRRWVLSKSLWLNHSF